MSQSARKSALPAKAPAAAKPRPTSAKPAVALASTTQTRRVVKAAVAPPAPPEAAAPAAPVAKTNGANGAAHGNGATPPKPAVKVSAPNDKLKARERKAKEKAFLREALAARQPGTEEELEAAARS